MLIIRSCVIAVALFFALSEPTNAQEINPDFLGMQGERIIHRYSDANDSSGSNAIVELRDKKGLPVWFGREVHQDVCSTGECRKLDLWVFWDGAGNYLGFQRLDEPLTKADHTHFNQGDYAMLHRILADSTSVLRDVRQEDLLSEERGRSEHVDARSGATRPVLASHLVKHAAYTTHTLWHIVYGPTRTRILQILNEKGSETYLRSVFHDDNINRKIWAIGFIDRNPRYRKMFSEEIIDLAKHKNDQVALHAMLVLFAGLGDRDTQVRLVKAIDEFSDLCKFELLWQLAALNEVEEEAILHLLMKFDGRKLDTRFLAYIYDLIDAKKIASPSIQEYLQKFLVHENLYVRTLTKRLLEM